MYMYVCMYKDPHYVVFSTPSSLLGYPKPMFLPQCEGPSFQSLMPQCQDARLLGSLDHGYHKIRVT